MAAPAKKSTRKSKVPNGSTTNMLPVTLNGPWSVTSATYKSAPATASSRMSSSSTQAKKPASRTKPAAHQGHFRLLDLPTELRKIVFNFYMENVRSPRQNIVVVEHKPDSKYHNRPELYQRKPDQDYKKKDKNRGKWDPKTKKFLPPPPSPIALLFSAKQMHQEALPALYGNGTFVFRTFREVAVILPMLRDGAKYLHSIDFPQGAYIKSWVGTAVETLQIAKSLKKLRISHHDVCQSQSHSLRKRKSASSFVTPETLLRDFLPLLKFLHASYQARHPKWSILDTIEVYEDPYVGWPCGCSDEELKKVTFMTELRRLIAEEFEMEVV